MLVPGHCQLLRPTPSVAGAFLPAGGLPTGKSLAGPAVTAMAKVAGQAMKARDAERLTRRSIRT